MFKKNCLIKYISYIYLFSFGSIHDNAVKI